SAAARLARGDLLPSLPAWRCATFFVPKSGDPVKTLIRRFARRFRVARDERGIALALVLLALVLMGAVVSGSFLAVRLDKSSSNTTTYSADAQGAAEAGLAEVYATWDPTYQSVMSIWDGTTATEIGTPLHNLGTNPYRQFADTVRRINNELFLVRSYGIRK